MPNIRRDHRIIALSGPKNSGKDTLAKALFKQNATYPNTFRRAPFAGTANPPTGVKGVCSIMFGYTEEHTENPVLKETPTEAWPFLPPRVPMMDIANTLRDMYGGDVHVQAWERRRQAAHQWLAHVITDHRFPEELEYLKGVGALIIYIQRDEAEAALQQKIAQGDRMAQNVSESHYAVIKQNADYVLENNGGVAEAANQLVSIVRKTYGHWSLWGHAV